MRAFGEGVGVGITVYLMDRRGRGASAALPLRDPETEIEDLRAVMLATNSRVRRNLDAGRDVRP